MKSRSFLSGSGIYLLSNILNAIIPLVLLPVLTRYLSPTEYGKIAMFQTLLGALGAFVGLSVVGAASRKYFDSEVSDHELKSFNASCLQILLISGAIVASTIFMLRGKFADWFGLQTNWIMWAIFVSAVSVIINLRLSQWQIRKEAKKYGVLQISQSVLNMLLSLLLVVVALHGAEGRIAAQVWTVAIFGLISLVLLNRSGLLSFLVWRPSYIKEALKFGVPLIPHISGRFLLTSVDRLVINVELGIAEAGTYMVAVQMAGAMRLVFDAVNKAYVPWLFERLRRNDPIEKRRIVINTYLWSCLVLVGTMIAFVIGPKLVTIIAGPQYAQSGSIIGWLVLGEAFGGMYLMVTNYVFYSKRTGLLSLVTIFSGFVNILLLVFMTKHFGIEGAAIAFCIAMALRFALTWLLAQKCHPMPWLGSG
jgi:O-antigen/teichoic acid export membrane protein